MPLVKVLKENCQTNFRGLLHFKEYQSDKCTHRPLSKTPIMIAARQALLKKAMKRVEDAIIRGASAGACAIRYSDRWTGALLTPQGCTVNRLPPHSFHSLLKSQHAPVAGDA